MKEVAYILGRVILLAPPDEILPLRGFYAPDALAAITKRYAFQVTPNLTVPAEQMQKDGLRFRFGKTPAKDGKGSGGTVNDFVIFPDGFVTDATHTDEADAFIVDLLKWGKDHLGLRPFTHPPRHVYASQVNVEFEAHANKMIKRFDDIAGHLGTLLMKTYNLHTMVDVHSVRFDYDRLTTPPLYNLVNFVIERKVGHKFEEELFWCQAPLRTTDHIESLQIIEKLLFK